MLHSYYAPINLTPPLSKFYYPFSDLTVTPKEDNHFIFELFWQAQGYILQTLRSKLLFDCHVYVDVWPGTPEVVILEFLTYRRIVRSMLAVP